jgi:GT2 family glycosyltransferase
VSATPPAPPGPDPQIAVVICAYTEERWSDLVEAVKSVRSQSVPAGEIVVVIDNSPQLLERAGRELGQAVVVANAHRQGLAGARNSGVAATSAPIVAFIDDDARAQRDWLEQLLIPYRQPDVLGVGGSIKADWRSGRPAWFPREFDWVVGCTYRGMPQTPATVRNLIGANMSVRREALDAVGGFSEELGRLPSGAGAVEETDFCIRVQERFPDGRWMYWPAAHVSHTVGPARATWAYFRARCINEGLAKATMVARTGGRTGLHTERRYVRRVLPAGVLRGLAGGLRGDRHAPARAGVIAAGLAYTVAGYLRGRLRPARARSGS